MDRTQAAEIQRHMRRAANAINRASEIIFALDEEHREVLGTPLQEIIVALHFKLLHAVYIRYPELRPPDPGRSRIDTARRWKDIVLPESVSETDLDTIIFSALTSRLQKTAMVIAKALKRCETLGLQSMPKSLAYASRQPIASKARAIFANGATVRCD